MPFVVFLLAVQVFTLASCVSPRPTIGSGHPDRSIDAVQTGMASWYGGKFHGRQTASGEAYDMWRMTAAHKTLPFGTIVRVTHSGNGKSVILRINDRGPFVKGRIIDVSRAAAVKLDLFGEGVAKVRLEVLSPD